MAGFKQRFAFVVLSVVIGLCIRAYRKHFTTVPIPEIHLARYWGPGDYQQDDFTIKPFPIEYSQENVDRLKKQLSTQIQGVAEPLEDARFHYGFNSKVLRNIVKYWIHTYLPKFDERLAYLNQFPHFKTQIQGLNIHFIHVVPKNPGKKKVVPLLLLHGWPGSVVEFYELIPLLTETGTDTTVFEVIVPSLPGYGFSDAAAKQGLGPAQAGVIMKNLMERLGHEKFYIQGGDWGSAVGKAMSSFFPRNVVGFHSNWLIILTQKSLVKSFIASQVPTWFVDKEHVDLYFPLGSKFMWVLEESGYLHLQSTKPDTIGTALSHNPVGLAAYILEKFSTLTNPGYTDKEDGGLEIHYSKDHLLDNIMVYYMTNSITSSVRFYKENINDELMHNMDRIQTNVPTACSRFPHEAFQQIDWVLRDKFPNLIDTTFHTEGGHFAAKQFPEVLFKDFVQFVNKVEALDAK